MVSQNVVVVGAGIAGLAHAWSAAERGHRVTVIERTPAAIGASIRNFGMVWPIGQPEETRRIAMRSRERWLRLADTSPIWVNPCGSIHMAHHPDEREVLQEFFETSSDEFRSHLKLFDGDACLNLSPAIQPDGFIGGLFSDTELCVNPSSAVRQMPKWLAENHKVAFEFNCTAVDISQSEIRLSSGKSLGFDRAVICSGEDMVTLCPWVFAQQPITKCKLQMMRTISQPEGWQLGPHLASGLTLRHYASFRDCSSLKKVIERVSTESPEIDSFGIHVMASQDNLGRVVLGDSHVYGEPVEPFDSEEIYRVILRELQKIIRLPAWKMDSYWNGVYTKCSSGICFQAEAMPNVQVFTGLGGNGMTLSFGLAEACWDQWEGKRCEHEPAIAS